MLPRVVRQKSKVAEVAVLSLGLVTYLVPSSVAQQAASPKRQRSIKPPQVLISPVQPSVEVLPAPRPLTPEQMPPVAPQISWDGEQLAISAENSTLGSILEAVKQTMGADIDVPAAAARERIVVHLGPGPAREVLSSLLAGSSFDYIIQAADDNPLSVQSILLTPRSKPGANPNDARSAMLASQSRRTFGNVMPNPPVTPEPTEESSAPVPQPSPAVSESAAAAPTQASPSMPQKPADATQAAATDANATSPDAQSAASDATRMQADLTTAAVSSSSDGSPASIVEQKVREMQNMFELRKQMQQQALKGNQSN
jgi:hypothetical protein